MDDQYSAMLRFAAAVPAPLRLKVRTADGQEQDQHFESPFVVIGRGPDCDIQLPDKSVSFRHVYLQAIGMQIACVDLLSLTGVKYAGPAFRGWLSPEHRIKVGNTELQLTDENWNYDETLKSPLDFRPRDEQRPEFGMLPMVDLELLNTSRKGAKWPINRVITLVGRDDRCRITVEDERLSRVQCALLLLPSGLWVIDLLGKGGVQLNGHTCRSALLSAGSELSIGPYKLGAHYPQVQASLEMAARAQLEGTGLDFLTRPNRIFQAEFYQDTLIVVPLEGSQQSLYQSMHMEASRLLDLVSQRGFNHVVIDFSRVSEVGHLLLEVLMSVCRAVSGQSALCGANAVVWNVLQASQLNRLFAHYESRQQALQAVYLTV